MEYIKTASPEQVRERKQKRHDSGRAWPELFETVRESEHGTVVTARKLSLHNARLAFTLMFCFVFWCIVHFVVELF